MGVVHAKSFVIPRFLLREGSAVVPRDETAHPSVRIVSSLAINGNADGVTTGSDGALDGRESRIA